MQPYPSLQTKQYCGGCEPALGAERRSLEAVLIHKHRAGLSPRLMPGSSPSQCVALLGSQPVREVEPNLKFSRLCAIPLQTCGAGALEEKMQIRQFARFAQNYASRVSEISRKSAAA